MGGTNPNDSLEKIREAGRNGGLGAAAEEGAGQLGRQAGEKGVKSLTGGVSGAVPGLEKAAGKVGEVAGKVAFKGVAGVAGGVVLLLILLVAGGGGMGFLSSQDPSAAMAPPPTTDQCQAMPDGWCDVAYSAEEATNGASVPVPWTLIAGLASEQTDYARTSPYDTIDRDPNRPVPPYLVDHPATTNAVSATVSVGQYGSVNGLNAEQMHNAAIIIKVGQQLGIPEKGWVIALATALQESSLVNLPGGDRDSAGLFQQRPSQGWGTLAQITNPVLATKAFYGMADHTHNPGLVDIPGWQQMAVTVAAQAVQHSGYPSAYADDQPTAEALVAKITGKSAVVYDGIEPSSLGDLTLAAATTGASSNTSGCEVAPPSAKIGGTGNEGSGPFLLTPTAAGELGAESAQNPCDAAQYVATKLAQAAQEIRSEGTYTLDPGGTVDDSKTFWQQVVIRADIMVGPDATATDCFPTSPTAPTSAPTSVASTGSPVTAGRYAGKPATGGRMFHKSGSQTYAFENSAAGIAFAGSHGYTLIDLDLQMTKDDQVIATHWGTVGHEFGDPAGNIKPGTPWRKLTWSQVQGLRATQGGYKVSRLEDLVPLMHQAGVGGSLEVKGDKRFASTQVWSQIAGWLNAAGVSAHVKAINTLSAYQDASLKAARDVGFWTRYAAGSKGVVLGKFTQPTKTDSGASAGANSGASGGSSTTETTSDEPVDAMIDDIWRCVLNQATNLYVASSATVTGSGTVSFSTYDRATGIDVLISEAKTVSWNFSKWKTTKCNPNARLAGIFPLTQEQATAAGAANRCDAQTNIRAAAQIVASGEAVPVADRNAPAGQPFAPMFGGWAKIPAALGNDRDTFALVGPSRSWHPSDTCSSRVQAYLRKVAQAGSPFAGLASADKLPADVTSYRTALAKAGANPAASAACAAPTTAAADDMVGQLADELASDVEQSVVNQESSDNSDAADAAASSSFGYDGKAMRGLQVWFSQQAAAIVPQKAVFGRDSMVDRLSSTGRVIATGPVSARVTVPAEAWQQAATDWAVFYGGLVSPWDTFGKRTGVLLRNAGQTADTASSWGTASQQAQIVIAAAKSMLGVPYSWGGGGPNGPSYGIGEGAHTKGFDCSGLTEYAFAQAGYHIGTTTGEQIQAGVAVTGGLAAAQPGDLLFFPGHVTIYLGDGMMIHAPHTGTSVRIEQVYATPIAIRRVVQDSALSTGVVSVTGKVVFPLPPSASFVDQHNWGHRSSLWAAIHTGDDYSTPCGTPVLAATDGVIEIRTDQSWSGPWLVMVSTGPGKLTTWYAHMQHIDVTNGEQVTAGEQIGNVGQEGNATGCHLHFEYHPRGGTIYEDTTDPDPWLQSVGAYPRTS